MLFLRLVLLILFIYIFQWPLEKIRAGQYPDNPTIFWLGLALTTIFPLYLLCTLLGVLWVSISHDNSKIRFHYLYKTIESSASGIDGYYRTTNKTKVSSYQGLLVKLKSGKVIEISEYNLKSIKEVGNFLQTNKVPLRGDKSSWFPLKRII
jgi:hypothetical protein